MNPDEAAFLSAIRTNPADETARLVYADWLADRDDPRADFARLSAEFLRCVRGLAALRQSAPAEWLRDVDPLFERLVVRALTELGTDGEATVDQVFVAPGSPISVNQPLFAILTHPGRTIVVATRPGLVTEVLVRLYQRVRAHEPLLVYLADADALARRAPPGPVLAHLHDLESRRAALQKDSPDLIIAMLVRYQTALRLIFGDTAYNAARMEAGITKTTTSHETAAQASIDTYIATVRVLLARHGQPAWFVPGAE